MTPFDYMQLGGVPLIALNVVIHVSCQALFTQKVGSALHGFKSHRHFVPAFAVVLGIAVIFGALTTYGHDEVRLEAKWQMMGALEALNGMLPLGLITAFLFATIQRVWPTASRDSHRR